MKLILRIFLICFICFSVAPSFGQSVIWQRTILDSGVVVYKMGNCTIRVFSSTDSGIGITVNDPRKFIEQTIRIKKDGKVKQSFVFGTSRSFIVFGVGPDLFKERYADKARLLPPEVKKRFYGYRGIK